MEEAFALEVVGDFESVGDFGESFDGEFVIRPLVSVLVSHGNRVVEKAGDFCDFNPVGDGVLVIGVVHGNREVQRLSKVAGADGAVLIFLEVRHIAEDCLVEIRGGGADMALQFFSRIGEDKVRSGYFLRLGGVLGL